MKRILQNNPPIFQNTCWKGALDFMCSQASRNEVIIAPTDFSSFFPKTYPYTQLQRGDLKTIGWMVLHREYLDGVLELDLELLLSGYRLVWSNEVFIIFQKRIPATKHFRVPLFLRSSLGPIAKVIWQGNSIKPVKKPTPDNLTPSTALVVGTFDRPSALARSLPQILALNRPVLVVENGISPKLKSEYEIVFTHIKNHNLHRLSLPENSGVAAAVNAGILYWLADPAIHWIAYFQDDVDVHSRTLIELEQIRHKIYRPLLCGSRSFQYPQLGSSDINGITVHHQWAASGQHFYGHRNYWKGVLPIP